MTEFAQLVSNDGYSFYLEKDACCQSEYLKEMLNKSWGNKLTRIELDLQGEVLKVIAKFLGEKYFYEFKLQDVRKAPEFDFDDKIALEVLEASYTFKL